MGRPKEGKGDKPSPLAQYRSTKGVAEELGISTDIVRFLVRQHGIQRYTLGATRVFDQAAFEQVRKLVMAIQHGKAN